MLNVLDLYRMAYMQVNSKGEPLALNNRFSADAITVRQYPYSGSRNEFSIVRVTVGSLRNLKEHHDRLRSAARWDS
jgi:hypothetical protein